MPKPGRARNRVLTRVGPKVEHPARPGKKPGGTAEDEDPASPRRRDGKTVLVRNMPDRNIAAFRCDDGRLRDTGQRIAVNCGPAAIRMADVPPRR